MSAIASHASEKLQALEHDHILSGAKVIPIFRKTGSLHEGFDAFTRARDVERVMDALPQIRAVVKAAERAYPFGMEAGAKYMGDALAALDKALSSKQFSGS